MLITVETILSFVILPLAVTLVAIISCGDSRPKHQVIRNKLYRTLFL